ncbi:MAG: ribose 5-phosphate isomerase B [Clostridiales bacterium]|nr:ribose 5-phosphate isomerase B [Clostridiales bacterium]
MIALGNDHAGYELKERIKKHLEEKNIEYTDYGSFDTESVDYPIYAAKAAHAVADGKAEFGILCCGTGIGVSIAANKVKGIRAACCYDEFSAEMSKIHNNANMICLGARTTDTERALRLVDIFLSAEAAHEERHLRRIKMLEDIENGLL